MKGEYHMEKLYDIKDKLCEELEEYARKQELGAGDLEVLHKLTDTIKNIDKIVMLEGEDGYSEDGEWRADIQGTYGRGSSYANRGKHYVRGHYSRDGGMGKRRYPHDGYSRGDGRSEMMEHLEMALDAAGEQDREAIKRFMRNLETA